MLTDQGREAVRMIGITRSAGRNGLTIKVRSHGKRPYLVVISVLLAAVIALGAVAVYQQNQLNTYSHDAVLVYGTLASSWVKGITATSFSSRIVFTSSSGSETTTVSDAAGHYWVSLPGGQSYNVTVYWNSNLSCSTACWPIISAPPTIVSATASPCPAGGCPTQHPTGGFARVSAMSPTSTSTQAVASGTNFGYLDLNSTTGSYNYNLSF